MLLQGEKKKSKMDYFLGVRNVLGCFCLGVKNSKYQEKGYIFEKIFIKGWLNLSK